MKTTNPKSQRRITSKMNRYREDPEYRAQVNAENRRWWKKHAKEMAEKRAPPKQKRRYYRYGITEDSFEAMWIVQQGRCHICTKDLARSEACIDHCHKTGKVRGLLCANCNRGIGFLKDDPEILERAVHYLRGSTT